MQARNKSKKSVSCPACGFAQNESPGAINTFCRSCGHHFELADKPISKPEEEVVTTVSSRGALARAWVWIKSWGLQTFDTWILAYEPQIKSLRQIVYKWRPPLFKSVRCHECAHIHDAPFVASSTSCPNCNAHIDLTDFMIDKRINRTIQTRGTLTIKKFGYLNNQFTICGNADISGGAAGKIFCDGETRINTTGRLNCEIGSRRIRIEKGADVIVAHPMRVHDLVVRGKLTARIYCNGTLRVLKHGFLRGEIYARSVIVDKGGLLQADLNISRFDDTNPEVLGTPQERACYMAISKGAQYSSPRIIPSA